jgi:hypothetical protein
MPPKIANKIDDLQMLQVYMFGEWYKPGCTLEYPVGGVGALIDALVRGLEKHGGKMSLNSHVEVSGHHCTVGALCIWSFFTARKLV